MSGQIDDPLHAVQGIVGVDQQRGARIALGEVEKCLFFISVGLDVAVRHRAHHGNTQMKPGLEVGRAGIARDRQGAGAGQRRIPTVRAPRAEIHHLPIAGGQHRAHALGGHERLVMDQIEHGGFDELCLGQRCLNGEDGLVGKADGAFRHGMDGAGEAEFPQGLEKIGRKATQAAQIVDFGRREVKVLQIVQHVRQSAGDQEIALCRQAAHEQLEHRGRGHALGCIGLHHGQLI